jgi:hypothetical protein
VEVGPVKASDVLKAARANVERGWCQGEYARDAAGSPVWTSRSLRTADQFTEPELLPDFREVTASVCSAGAIYIEPLSDGMRELALRYLAAEIKDCEISLFEESDSVQVIACFNDTPGRTKGEVLDKIDHAIKHALEDEAS